MITMTNFDWSSLSKVALVSVVMLWGCDRSVQQNYQDVTKSKNPNQSETIPEWIMLNVDEALPSQGLNLWIPTNDLASSSLIRVPKFPRKFSALEIANNPALTDFEIKPVTDDSGFEITAVKNEQVSLQVALANRQDFTLTSVTLENLKTETGAIIDHSNIQVRYVKYLPVQRARSEYVWSPRQEKIVGEGVSGNMAPNVVGDPLLVMETLEVAAYTAQPIWITIKVPKNTNTGRYLGIITLNTHEYGQQKIPIQLKIEDMVLPDPKDYKFNLDLWINPTAIAEHYKLEHWSDQHWALIQTYLEDYLDKGGKNITTTITHEPWHKPWLGDSTHSQIEYGYRSMVAWTKTKEGNWSFDYSIFDQYVSLAMKVGLSGAINAYSLTPFHTRQKIQYTDASTGQQKVVELDLNDRAYKDTWIAFLQDFKDHLIAKGWFERTYLGFDEKPEAILQTIKGIIREGASELLDRVVIAGHPETTSLAQNLSISYMFFPGQALESRAVVPVLPTIAERNENGQQTTFYLCAEPAHPNTLTFSPAVEAQLIPWLALKYRTNGYLRWAYNNWTSDTYNKPVFLHTQGDDYYVYPGKHGPISSIRWELLKEGIEDYELYRLKAENSSNQAHRESAIELATRSQDGRYKKTRDMVEAKALILAIE
jgi:hypothetical protein